MQSYACNNLIQQLGKALESADTNDVKLYQILKSIDQNGCGNLNSRSNVRDAMDLTFVPFVPMFAKRWAALNAYESLVKS